MIDTHLYHGTSSKFLDRILSRGLIPRGSRSGNWKSYPSRRDMVYLTSAYAPYFAWSAVGRSKEHRAVVFEVNTSGLCSLFPDEDFIAQAIARTEGKAISEVHTRVRRTLTYYADFAGDSLKHLGNVSHLGPIPPTAITRYVSIDLNKQKDLANACMDPTISLINYQVCGSKYRSIISWLFGDRKDFEVGAGLPNEQYVAMMSQIRPGYSDEVAKVFENRDGIEVVQVAA